MGDQEAADDIDGSDKDGKESDPHPRGVCGDSEDSADDDDGGDGIGDAHEGSVESRRDVPDDEVTDEAREDEDHEEDDPCP